MVTKNLSTTVYLQVIWNVQFITVFVPAWMIPPVYHSLRRESIKNASSASAIGVQSVRPTWFEDIAVPKDTTPQPNQDPQGQQPQPLHGLKLVIKEEVLPMKDQPEFPSLELLAARGLLAPDTWKCKRAQVSLKATIDVPMLGTIIEQNGDGLLDFFPSNAFMASARSFKMGMDSLRTPTCP